MHVQNFCYTLNELKPSSLLDCRNFSSLDRTVRKTFSWRHIHNVQRNLCSAVVGQLLASARGPDSDLPRSFVQGHGPDNKATHTCMAPIVGETGALGRKPHTDMGRTCTHTHTETPPKPPPPDPRAQPPGPTISTRQLKPGPSCGAVPTVLI